MSNRATALFRQAARLPAKPAVLFEGQVWTFSDLLGRAQAYAAGLADAGFRRGDKLGLMIAMSRREIDASDEVDVRCPFLNQ